MASHSFDVEGDVHCRLFPYIVAVGLLGAVATIVWLLVVGVNEQRWKEQAYAAAASIWR